MYRISLVGSILNILKDIKVRIQLVTDKKRDASVSASGSLIPRIKCLRLHIHLNKQ